jgi:outer membrane protein OmpA-like peptidoglycan-associated protein
MVRAIPTFLAGAAALALVATLPPQAQAQGWYVGVEGGWSHLNTSSTTVTLNGLVVNPLVNGGPTGSLTPNVSEGYAAGGFIGYEGILIPNLRLEGEVVYRGQNLNSVSGGGGGTVTTTGSINSLGLMANLLYDFKNVSRWTPYIGGGIGAADVKLDGVGIPTLSPLTFSNSTWEFAYQAIGGVKYNWSPNWSVGLDYRYFATLNPTFSTTIGGVPVSAKTKYNTHNVMLGIAYHFVPPPPPPPVAPMPTAQPAPPPPPPARTFIVYFDYDKANLTPDGATVVQQAAGAFRATGSARIMVTGYTDLAGTQQYNLGLSKRRADTVKTELVKDGVPAAAIVEAWRGKENPAVPTADGVREARNRRVEIVM